MRRFLFSLTFCAFLLASGAFILTKPTAASDDVVSQLLRLPAPPPPNPFVPIRGRSQFSDRKVPPDDAPIEELLEYWRKQSDSYEELRYNPAPSPRVLDRIRIEIAKDPETVVHYVNIFRDSTDGADFVKRIYDNWPANATGDDDGRPMLRQWLKMNSRYFTGQLEKAASRAGERGEYVNNHEQLLALAKYDWDAARPNVDRLYADAGQPVSRVLAAWALYVHALEENSPGDIDRYRDELKTIVEDKKATAGMRDLAFNALVKEKEWSGRDDWYYTLLEDETLADLRVNDSTYTGLTTLVLYSHPDKYADKMIELVKSSNRTARGAAARNLGEILSEERPDVVKALLPWLEDPKWAADIGGTRMKLLQILQSVKIPESVPGLIAALDEKETVQVSENEFASNTVSNSNRAVYAANMAVNNAVIAMNRAMSAANAANSNTADVGRSVTHYPHRFDSVGALALQADMRAAPALRRILRESQGHERTSVVKALLRSKGFSVAEQANALETFARTGNERRLETPSYASNAVANSVGYSHSYSIFPNRPFANSDDLDQLLAVELLQVNEPGDQLIREIAARISLLEKREPETAMELRNILLGWKGTAVNTLLLKDLKDGKANADAIVKLLSVRKELKEKQSGEIFDIRTSNAIALGTSACLLESERDYAAILNGENIEAKSALFACARLIRAKLPVKEVAKYVSHTDKLLAVAAESYLESEDSTEARAVVLSLHPGEAKIMGATTAFWPEGTRAGLTFPIVELFGSVGPSLETVPGMNPAAMMLAFGAHPSTDDKSIREEVKADPELLGIYKYKDNFIHIRKDRVTHSWGEDESRFYERTLSKEEFGDLKQFLNDQRVDELPPFLDCANYCEDQQLLMVGKNGGRRVFVKSIRVPEFFRELNAIFDRMREGPAKLRYRIEKEIAGLEILLADDDLAAQTVWGTGSEVRVLLADAVKRKEIDLEIKQAVEEMEEAADDSGEEADDGRAEQRSWELDEKRKFENFQWFGFGNGRLGAKAVQPLDAEFIPVPDSFAVTPGEERWKAKAASVEVRVDDDGLHKLAAGKLTQIKSGEYTLPVLTANGRWAFATKSNEDGRGLVRINLANNREYPVVSEKYPVMRAVAYVASVNKILASQNSSDEYVYDKDGTASPGSYRWVDPETGAVTPAKGEFGPLEGQSFRPLQPGPAPFEFWAAMPDSNGQTKVGIYSTRTFTFRPVMTAPKISFNSMDMWVDAAAGKVYFVYNGHLLALPLVPKTVGGRQ